MRLPAERQGGKPSRAWGSLVLFTTDVNLAPEAIIGAYTGRWSVEVTFQEVRFHLGLNTPRNWRRTSVLRTTPCLFGLYSLVCLIFQEHLKTHPPKPCQTPWYDKPEITFADAIATVRRLFWNETIFARPQHQDLLQKFPASLRVLMLDRLAYTG